MGWKDAPLVEAEPTKSPAWMSAPVVGEPAAEPGSPLPAMAASVLTDRVSAPEVGGAAQTVKRVWDASKEMFVPSKEGAKRLLNPLAGRFGVSRLAEEEGQRVAGAVRKAGENIAEDVATSRLANISPSLAAGTGAAISTVADVASESLTPSSMQQQMGFDTAGTVARGTTAAVQNKVAAGLEKASLGAGRRGLGFLKSQLNKLRRSGGVERANAVAAEMIKQKVVTPLSSADEMLSRAQALDQQMGNKIGEVISRIDKAGMPTKIDPLALSQKVEEQLIAAAGKGATPAQRGAVKEIVDRILQTADESGGLLSFSDTQAMKEIFQKNGHWASASDAFKADAYRRASGIVNAELRKAIGAAGREMGDAGKAVLDEYLAANLSKGKTRDAINALTDLTNKQAGNRFVDPFTAAGSIGVAGVGAIAGEPIMGGGVALAAVLAKRLSDSYGAQLTAVGLNKLAKIVSAGKVPERALSSPLAARAFVEMLNGQQEKKK
jgi:hypothetical protein